MEIFNKKINIRDYICSSNGGFSCSNNKVNLYVYTSGYCSAKCSFCSGFKSRKEIDIDKLKKALVELHDKQVINRISITGGEPLEDLYSLNLILKTIFDVCERDYHISINTNGTNLNHLKNIEFFFMLNDVHISRHSKNDMENNQIFGIKTPTFSQIKKEIDLNPNIFSLSCNLLSGYVDSVHNMKEYLDDAIKLGVYQVGFVSLMNKTESCDNLFIDYEDITSKLEVSDGFLFEKFLRDKDSCKCENYSYYNDYGEIPFYLRRILGGEINCVKAFVFDSNSNLITNFGKGLVLL